MELGRIVQIAYDVGDGGDVAAAAAPPRGPVRLGTVLRQRAHRRWPRSSTEARRPPSTTRRPTASRAASWSSSCASTASNPRRCEQQLSQRGTGVHHVAYFTDDLEREAARLDELGYPQAMLATTASGRQFAFHDAVAELGHLLEIYELDDGLGRFYAMVADAAVGLGRPRPRAHEVSERASASPSGGCASQTAMELLLIRHALPVRIEDVEGPADPELSQAGLDQAGHLAEYLAFERVHAIYASPLRRAHQTALAVAERQGIDVVLADGIAEYDRDASEYIPVEQMKAEGHQGWQDILQGGVHQSMGIDPYEFRAGVVTAIEQIITDHPGQKAAAVCHGGVINAYLTHILGIEDPSGFFYPNYTSIHRVAAARSGERSVLTINETAHLRGTGLPIGLFGGLRQPPARVAHWP